MRVQKYMEENRKLFRKGTRNGRYQNHNLAITRIVIFLGKANEKWTLYNNVEWKRPWSIWN